MYIAVQSIVALVAAFDPKHSPLGIAWIAVTAVVMFALAAGKDRTGSALGNPVLRTEGRVTFIDALTGHSGIGRAYAQRRRGHLVG